MKKTALADIEIAAKTKLQKITDVARGKIGIESDALELFGHYKAKLSLDFINSLDQRPDGKLVLVTSINPTPLGEGKTTTTVGLGDALNRLGEKAMICIREPSLGPCFGIKGGAAGGGYAQVAPMEDINLHFTGDFHAVALAHNLLAAMTDNHIHQGALPVIDPRRIEWRRVVDLNDRALRNVIVGLGGTANSYPREEKVDIVAASEIMAILCLSTSLEELKHRLGHVIVGHDRKLKSVTAADLSAQGAMATLLKDAVKPNLVQTLEHNPALVHGGPFANIAHGCNSVIATRTALKLADYVITEAGFGADLGAEKFFDIKCRKASLQPALAVVVATVRALKYHGGMELEDIAREDTAALAEGIANLERHVENIRNCFHLPCIVAINRFSGDSDAEVNLLMERMTAHGIKTVVADHWAKGGAGAESLAREVIAATAGPAPTLHYAYDEKDSLWSKINQVAQKVYRASEAIANTRTRDQIHRYQDEGYGHLPVCIAKSQYSFSSDPQLRGAPTDHVLPVRDVSLAAGAEFLVAKCGSIMTMPGLPAQPAACRIDISASGKISGLF